ncbi:DUF429 domain-containing protein, partial [Metallosphaera hakonensis]
MECGIDLAVKRKSAVAVLEGKTIEVKFLMTDEELINTCRSASVVAIDAPLTYANGFREVDRLLISKGLRVFPPSFIKSLTERGIRLAKHLRAIETHPTSSFKLLGWDWRTISKIKDEADSVISVLTAHLYLEGGTLILRARDGEIHLLNKSPRLQKTGEKRYELVETSSLT